MSTSRRNFFRWAAGGALGLYGAANPDVARAALWAGESRARNPLRILILGGTGFIGPYQVNYAVQRGHRVTVFNRGRRQGGLPDSVEQLLGDRNNDLSALRGREWDVVIDNPTTLPFWVRDAASLLRDHANQYIFISTISVYRETSRPGMDEDTPLAVYGGSDPMAETMESFQQNVGGLYGALKAISEQEAERWFPGRTTIIRPGLIVGPGDPTDRFTYWPARVARGGEVLAPGTPADPVQIIDARDISEWTIRMAENNVTGVYNATGPATELSIGSMLEAMTPLAAEPVRFNFVPAEFLAEQKVRPWADMPTWLPPVGDTAGFARVSIARALQQGLTFRPTALTARDTLEWHRTRTAEQQTQLRAGISAEREAEVLAAWKQR